MLLLASVQSRKHRLAPSTQRFGGTQCLLVPCANINTDFCLTSSNAYNMLPLRQMPLPPLFDSHIKPKEMSHTKGKREGRSLIAIFRTLSVTYISLAAAISTGLRTLEQRN